MSRYVVEAGHREGESLVVLRDTASAVAAQLWPGCGNNCFDLTLAAPDGHPVTVIQAPPVLDEIRRRPSWWGIPLLFPFPGSIPRGEYAFQGRRLRLGRPEQPIVSEGHEAPGARRDFHGFVMDLPWQVATTADDDVAATVCCTLDAADHPQTLEGFPFPFRVEATYRLDQQGLHLRFGVTNSGEGQLPFGFGAHPFFRLPLGAHGAPADCLVRIPAGRRWDGRRLRALLESDGDGEGGPTAPVPWDEVWGEVCPPVRAPFDLRTPQPFVAGAYNGAYTDLTASEGPEGGAEATLIDSLNRLQVTLRAGPAFRNVVFWSPPGRPELCFEPWTCPSNVFNLAAQGVPHHGLTVLDPGHTWAASMRISLSTTLPAPAP